MIGENEFNASSTHLGNQLPFMAAPATHEIQKEKASQLRRKTERITSEITANNTIIHAEIQFDDTNE